MDPTIWLVALLCALPIAVIVVVRILGIQILTVKDGQQMIVSRFGRIQRILRPGLNLVFNGFEKVEREINVREQPGDVYIDVLFIRGVPFGYTLNLWWQNDLFAAAKGNNEQWRKLALFTDKERRDQVVEKVRNGLVRCLTMFEKDHDVMADSSFVRKLLPIFPATPNNDQLLDGLRNELAQTLPTIGVILSQSQPIIVKKIHLGNDLREMFTLSRTVTQLRELVPNMSPDIMLRLFGSIEGLDMSHMRELTLRQYGATAGEIEIGDDLDTTIRTPTSAGPAPAPTARDNAVVITPAAEEERIRKEDLNGLKTVPRFASS
jgi:hypothetical protein